LLPKDYSSRAKAEPVETRPTRETAQKQNVSCPVEDPGGIADRASTEKLRDNTPQSSHSTAEFEELITTLLEKKSAKPYAGPATSRTRGWS
jgi:hypothetical protein